MIPTPEHSRPRSTWPTGHQAWIFDGEGEFEGRVARFLADGLARGERAEAWIRWERVADEFMSENPVTGLCGFDRLRSEGTLLRRLVTMHPHAVQPTPG